MGRPCRYSYDSVVNTGTIRSAIHWKPWQLQTARTFFFNMWAAFLTVLLVVVSGAANDRPIVGIVTQPSEYGWPEQGSSYIAASYVKFVEASGARVVPGESDQRMSLLLLLTRRQFGSTAAMSISSRFTSPPTPCCSPAEASSSITHSSSTRPSFFSTRSFRAARRGTLSLDTAKALRCC